MTSYQITFSYTVEMEISDESDERDAEEQALEEFSRLLRDFPSTSYFSISTEELEDN